MATGSLIRAGVLAVTGVWGAAHAGPGFPGGFRISDLGPPGDPEFDALAAAVAYNSGANEFLVAWMGDTGNGPTAYALFGQRIDAATGAEVGPDDLPIGATGHIYVPDIAYNRCADEYLVVWYDQGDVKEIYVQRLDAAGNQIGVDDAQISQSGNQFPCVTNQPDVAYNPMADEYLVTWTAGCFGDRHIFGQRLDGAGAEIGADDFHMDDDGSSYVGTSAIAYNSRADEYLVVWGAGNTVDDWIVARRFDATGVPLTGEIVVSAPGDFWSGPEVAYNPLENEYLVVWSAVATSPADVDVFGQRLDATGVEIGADDFRISDMGEGPGLDATGVEVAHDEVANEYLVAWAGRDAVPPLVEGESEVFGQRLTAGALEVGPDDFRISRMGPDGDPLFAAGGPAAAFAVATGEFLVAWNGDDDNPPQVQGEKEIFIRRLGCPWDCGDGDGVVGMIDLQMLVTQWGVPGTCDADGGGVTATDLLELLAAWGQCP